MHQEIRNAAQDFSEKTQTGDLCDTSLSGELPKHLEDTDRLAHERMQLLTKRMAEAQGVTEALKADNSMEWTSRMNNIRSCVEEAVMAEVIYA